MSRHVMGNPHAGRRSRRAAIATLVVLAVCGGLASAGSAAERGIPAAAAADQPNPVVTINDSDSPEQIREKAAKVTPSERQLAWQREELTGFIHISPNTFLNRQWGSGAEDPDSFNPSNLDTDQWARTFKDAGFKKVILTAKHHDGFLLFPSAYSKHGVKSSAWRDGKGDVLKAFADSARKYGLKVGVYLSPSDGAELPHQWWKEEWVPEVIRKHNAGEKMNDSERATYDDRDRMPGGEGRYGNGSEKKSSTIPSNGGDGPKFTFEADDFNRYYMNTLYEVLTKYGKLDEVWLDGANPWSESGITQEYNFTDWFKMIRELQPSATVFGGPDVRWVGNELGLTTRASEWSVVPQRGTADPDGERNPTSDPRTDNLAGDDKLTTDADYLAWHPAECDGMLQGHTWFWNDGVKASSLDTLKNMYLNSVGKNCQLLLNVAPDKTGRFPADAVTRMKEFGEWQRSVFATNEATGAKAGNDTGTSNTPGNDPGNVLDTSDSTAWQPTGTTGNLVLNLGSNKTFNTVNLQENIQVGQRTSGFAVDVWNGSSWQEAGKATTIGYRRILKLSEPVTTDKVRLRITSSRALPPAIATFGLYDDRPGTNLARGKSASQSSTLSSTTGADRAVDGNTSGEQAAGDSVTHTSLTPLDTNPWWQVDLDSSQHVGKVKLFNRTDCCSDRLGKFYVFASDKPITGDDPKEIAKKEGVWSHYQEAAVSTSVNGGTSLTLDVGRNARYLRVQLAGSDRPLSLAEFQAFG